MSNIPTLHFPADGVDDPLLIPCPERGDQVPFGSVSGEPVHHDVRMEPLQTGKEDVQIFLHGQGIKQAQGIIFRKIRSPKHMERLQFESVGDAVIQLVPLVLGAGLAVATVVLAIILIRTRRKMRQMEEDQMAGEEPEYAEQEEGETV